ncbi:YciI family protein [Parvicella tangerina]|uniref:YCII-related domain-containing protein n=1 Tax=Parvicella tangerina TaxID=2829795 RepID=A0A916NJN1_9FLAO|nr:YciI family protein [Parvicella tangerina]CAG5086325.1 hypothetical protein CRYO30217_03083 [Parvicella tangerina]
MRKLATPIVVFVALLTSCTSPSSDAVEESKTTPEAKHSSAEPLNTFEYDSVYAAKLGADDYGMKSYVMAFLKSGPNRPEDPDLIDSLQAAHLGNIHKLAEEGKLVLAGPFYGGNDELRGIYIFDTDSIEEAASWTATDPAIIYGSLEMELKKWYGSAALMEVNNLHKKAAKIDF